MKSIAGSDAWIIILKLEVLKSPHNNASGYIYSGMQLLTTPAAIASPRACSCVR
jgi:hypothetical protein